MRVELRSGAIIDWFPTLAAAVAAHPPEQIEWCIPGLPSVPLPAAGEAARVKAFPTAVSVERGGVVRRRPSPGAPVGTVVCYFLGGPGEVALNPNSSEVEVLEVTS